MIEYSIFTEDNSSLALLEAEHRGYKADIYVKISKQYFKVSVYSIFRLAQDFEVEFAEGGHYDVPNNLILVKNVTPESIRKAVINSIKGKYFDKVKPSDVDNITLFEI